MIYAVSDATGQLAFSLAYAAGQQFPRQKAVIVRRPHIASSERIDKIVQEAQGSGGLIVFTLVSDELRRYLSRVAAESHVSAVDVMGPLLETFTKFLHADPSDRPGLQYQLTAEYFRRNEALEFAVKHDDSLGLDTLHQADMILLGISRTSKTPLSIYLAYRGFKVANVPIIQGAPLPLEVREVDGKKLVGLTIQADKLAQLRSSRLSKMGRQLADDYASLESIREELSAARKVFQELGNIPVVDVTGKAIEEVASEILSLLGK